MHIIEIPEKKAVIYLPSDLSECDPVQYIEAAALILNYQSELITYEDFRVHLLYKLSGIKQVNKQNEDLEKFSRIYQLSELLDSFFEINEKKQNVLKQYYIHNPIPNFRGNFRYYYGPDDDFEKITFGEYLDTLEAFINFNQTGEIIFLLNMVAINYRKKGIINNKRLAYIPDEVPKRSELFKHQHIGIIYGFYLLFASFQKYISTAVIYVQGNEVDLSILFEGNSSSKKSDSEIPGLGMKGILLSLAETGIYGPIGSVRNENLFEILIKMYDITKRNIDENNALKNKK